MSTYTYLSYHNSHDKTILSEAFVGKSLSSLRTPALIVDRTRFRANCERVTSEAKRRGMKFRAHVKSALSPLVLLVHRLTVIAHKTTEGTRLQLEASGGIRALICSTMVEVWQIIENGLVEEQLVDDVRQLMTLCRADRGD